MKNLSKKVEKNVILTDASSVTVNGVSIIPDDRRITFDGDLISADFYGDITFVVFSCTYGSEVVVSIANRTTITPIAIKDVLNSLGAVSAGIININPVDIHYMDYDDYIIAVNNGWSVPLMNGAVFIEADSAVKINGEDRTPVNDVIYIPNTEVDSITTNDFDLNSSQCTYVYHGRYLRIRRAWCSPTFNSISNIVSFSLNNCNIDISGLKTVYANVINAKGYAVYCNENPAYCVSCLDDSIKHCIVSMENAFTFNPLIGVLGLISPLTDSLTMDDFPALTNGSRLLMNCRSLQNVSLSLPALTNGSSMLNGCRSLQNVNLSLPALTDGSYMLDGCRSLQSVTLSFPALTDGSYMLRNCISLQNITLSLPSLTNGSYMFSACRLLQGVTLSLPSLTDGREMFSYCSRLQNITLSFPAITNCMNMFNSCSDLQSVNLTLPALTDGSRLLMNCRRLQNVNLTLPALTNGSSMLNGCSSLQTVTLTLPALTDGSRLLMNCTALQSVTLTLPALTDGSLMLYNCIRLQSVSLSFPALTNCNINNIFVNINILSFTFLKIAVNSYKAEYDVIIKSTVLTYLNLGDGEGKVNFNLTVASTVLVSEEAVTALANSLATVTGKTITLSAETKSALTTYNLMSAITGKGWTVA